MAAPNVSPFPADEKSRTEWVQNTLAAAQRGHYDGITFDYESPIAGERRLKWVGILTLSVLISDRHTKHESLQSLD